MRKLVGFLVILSLIVWSSPFTTYAKDGNSGNTKGNKQKQVKQDKDDKGNKDNEKDKAKEEKGGSSNKDDKKETIKSQDKQETPKKDRSKTQPAKSKLDILKQQLKDNQKDKQKRKELIKQIIELKNKNKEKSSLTFINGEEVASDMPPVIKGGKVLVPVAPIVKALGANLTWDQKSQTVTVTQSVYGCVYGQENTVIIIKVVTGVITINGKEVKLEAPAQSVNNRTMVPVSFIKKVLKREYEYDKETGAVIIDNNAPKTTGTTPAPGTSPTPAPTTTTQPAPTPTPTPSPTPSPTPTQSQMVTPTATTNP